MLTQIFTGKTGNQGRIYLILLLMNMIIVLSACSSLFKPIDRSLEFQIPKQWKNVPEKIDAQPKTGWLKQFNDARLEQLVHEAYEQNFDLRIYLTRLETARALGTKSSADRWPSFSWGIRGKKGTTINEFSNGPLKGEVSSEKFKEYGLFLGTSWEIDLWGKLRDRSMAGKAELEASRMEMLGFRKSLASMIAKAWYNAITARLQLKFAKKTLKNYEAVTSIVRSRFEAGLADALDLKLSLAQVADSKALTQLRSMEYQQEIFRLQILLGRYPDGNMTVQNHLPNLNFNLSPVVPSHLVKSRPDILEVRHRLMAADYRILESKKALLPSLNLTGEVGSSSRKLRNITDPDYFVKNFIGGLTQPIFDGHRMEAEILESESVAWEIYLEYSRTVLKAFREVEEALAMDSILSQREITLKNAVALSTGAEKLAWDKYTMGMIDIFNILESQRRVLENTTEYLEARHALIINRIDLYLALGLDSGLELIDGKI